MDPGKGPNKATDGKPGGAGWGGSVGIPDMPERSSHRQSVPVEAEEELDDLPPPYEPSPWSSGSGSAAPVTTGPGTAPTATTTATPAGTRTGAASSSDSPRSSVSAHEHDGLMATLGGDDGRQQRRPCSHFPSGGCGARKTGPSSSSAGGGGGVDSTGYHANTPMQSWDDGAKWTSMEDQPGFCCSDSAGCFGSSHGGCCFSDRGGCFFSDRGGCCFSDTGGCFFSKSGGCCFSESGGCCFGSEGACCCSDGPARR